MIKIITIFSTIMRLVFFYLNSQDNQIECPFQLIEINCSMQNTGTFIINNPDEFKKLCHASPPFEINFEKETLIGVVETIGSCQEPISNIKVLQNVESKSLECLVSIESFGSCRRLFPIIQWFIISKPLEEYEINITLIKVNN